MVCITCIRQSCIYKTMGPMNSTNNHHHDHIGDFPCDINELQGSKNRRERGSGKSKWECEWKWEKRRNFHYSFSVEINYRVITMVWKQSVEECISRGHHYHHHRHHQVSYETENCVCLASSHSVNRYHSPSTKNHYRYAAQLFWGDATEE